MINISKIIKWFIIVQPILDIINLFIYKHSGFQMGSIIKGPLMLIFISVTILFNIDIIKNKKNVLYFIILIFFYVFHVKSNEMVLFNLDKNIYSLVKTLIFPIMILVLDLIIDKVEKTDINRALEFSIVIIFIIFIMAKLTNTYEYSYETMKVGNKAWFFSGNEIGSILALLFPFSVFYYLEERNFYRFLLVGMVLIPCFMIGIKTTIVSIIITMFIVFIISVYRSIKNYKSLKNRKFNMLFGFIIILLSLILIYNSSTLEIFISRMNIVYDRDSLITKILSGRDIMLINNFEVFQNYLPRAIFFGIGNKVGISEMDFFDIIIRYGFIGFIIVFYPMLNLLFSIKSELKQYLIGSITDYKKTKYFVPIIIGTSLSFLVGHVVVAPSVSFYLSILFIAFKLELKGDIYV